MADRDDGRCGVSAGDAGRRRAARGGAGTRARRRLASGVGGSTSEGPQRRCHPEPPAVRGGAPLRVRRICVARPLSGGRYRGPHRRQRLHPNGRGRYPPTAREGAVHGRRWPPGWRCWRATAATRWCAATGISRTPSTTSRRGKPTSRSQGSCRASGSGSPTCSTPAGSTWCASCTPACRVPTSWWSWRGRAFDNDAGWRIDYQLATPDLAARASAARVERAAAYALRWSDHAPVTVEYLAAARS